MSSTNGPYPTTLPAQTRRLGRGGRAYLAGAPGTTSPDLNLSAGDYLGTVTAVTWTVSSEQISVPIPGQWRTHMIAGAETRSGTMRYQDVDDRWRMVLYNFFSARDQDIPKQPPRFDLLTVLTGGPLDASGASVNSEWVLEGCRIYGYDGGFSSTDDVIERELTFTFENERPQNAFQYTTGVNAVGNPNFAIYS